LQSLRGLDLRPTADRLRETLFDVLTAGNPSVLEGTAWLDLFAGTGAVGIEALSRGAGMVYFVESSPRAAELIDKNLESLKIGAGFVVMKKEALRALGVLSARNVRADFVFLDPPYRMEAAYGETLAALADSGLLRPGGVAIAEHYKKFDPPPKVGGLERYRLLKPGDAALSFYR
jgi:16S rRNA (guanine966-N2)-methyltransferase